MREFLLLDLGGLRYGVWKDEILSQDLQVIHWLTTTANVNYAISIINKHTITLVDLSACIGLAPISRESKSPVLLMSEQDKVAGFLVEGEIEQLHISSDAVCSMPEYLQTPIIDTCVLFGSALIPVINISELKNRVEGVDFAPVVPNFQLPAGSEEKEIASSLKHIRIFASSGKTFAAPAGNSNTEMVKVGSISGLALTPKHIKGITFHNGTVLPVIDLASRMEQPTKLPPDQMLIVAMADQHFGFLVDEDVGALSCKHFSVKSLPRLVRSDWLQIAAILTKRIIPIIDLRMLLSARADAVEQESLTRKFILASQFKSRFGKEEVEVVEFDLLGVLHALPRLEAGESFPFKACRPIPNTDLIVAGVVVHEGELLPVLDLARCFGKRSLPTEKWRLILVKNGDFRVFVMTEFLVGERKLSVDMQRELPFEVPDSVVYGCYPIESSVRLILNIQALTVYFDNEQAKKFINMFSGDLQKPSIEFNASVQESLVQKFDPQKEISDPPEHIEEEERGEEKEYAVTEKPDLLSAIVESAGLFSRDIGLQTRAEKVKEVKTRLDLEPEEVEEEKGIGAVVDAEVEAVLAEVLKVDESEAEPDVKEPAEEGGEGSGTAKGEEPKETSDGAEFLEIEEHALIGVEARGNVTYLKHTEDRDETVEADDTGNIKVEEMLPLINAEAQPIVEKIDQLLKQMIELGGEPEAKEVAVGKDDVLKEFSELLASDLIKEKEPLLPLAELDDVSLEEVAPEHKRRQRWQYASLVFSVLVIAFFPLSGVFEKWSSNVIEQENVEEAVPAKKTTLVLPELPEPHQAKVPIVNSPDSADLKIIATKKEVPVAQEKSASMTVEPAAILEPFKIEYPVSVVAVSNTVEPKKDGAGEPVVANKAVSIPVQLPKVSAPEVAPTVPADYITYTVQEADTLWLISEHYTGSGLNYQKLIEENKIQNPDLIFPDQKIIIKKIEVN